MTREILQSETFQAEPAAQEALRCLEFLNEATGERRQVPLEAPMTMATAYVVAADHRQPGEILLRVL